MKTTTVKDMFHYISYLQYPLMLVAVVYLGRMYYDIFALRDEASMLRDANNILLFMGVAISFSTLQDTGRVQNKFSKRVWESPQRGKIVLIMMFIMAIGFMIFGFYGLFSTTDEALAEMSLGLLVLGIGVMGLLKTAIEMYENHRLDKKNS